MAGKSQYITIVAPSSLAGDETFSSPAPPRGNGEMEKR